VIPRRPAAAAQREAPLIAVGTGPDQASVAGDPEHAACGRGVVGVDRPRDRDVGRGGEPDTDGEAAPVLRRPAAAGNPPR
jgi:hypothetical protein